MKKEPNNNTSMDADFFLDITDEVCPLTFVKTKLLLEKMTPGQTAEVLLKGEEPLDNVPKSVERQGDLVLSLEPVGGGAGPDAVHRLRVQRKRP